MPPRSVKMKRRIFGFQRRVWWPKWTPASSSSRIETAGKGHSPLTVDVCFSRRDERGNRRQSTGTVHVADPPGRERNARILAKLFQIPRQLGRQRRLDLQTLAGEGVLEGKPARMQELTAQGGLGDAVDGIADNGQPDRREVDTDLVRPARLEVDAEKRVRVDQLHELEVRDGVARAVRVQRLARWISPVAPDRRLDPSLARSWPPSDERGVRALEPVAPDEPLKALVGLVRASDDEQSRRVAVEPVDDSRAFLVSAGGAVGEDAVDQGAGRMAGRRVDDDAGRLVDDQQLVVFVRDPELDLLGRELRSGFGRFVFDLLPTSEPTALGRRLAVNRHTAGLEQPFRGCAGSDLRQVGEEPVEPQPGRAVRNGDSSQERGGAAPGRRGAAPR